jgi:hypothetical protein
MGASKSIKTLAKKNAEYQRTVFLPESRHFLGSAYLQQTKNLT